jgi:mRNA-degrading endonuclease HigB of HigAB toxin-antitoxin module
MGGFIMVSKNESRKMKSDEISKAQAEHKANIEKLAEKISKGSYGNPGPFKSFFSETKQIVKA